MRTRWRVTTATMMFSGLLGLISAAPALAQPVGPVSEATKDTARSSYRAAELKLKEGNFQLALQYYSQAESILPVPTTKYKIALCHDRLGHQAEAVKWYQLFLASSPPEKMADAINDARSRLSVLSRNAGGQIRVSVTPYNAPGVSVSVDGGPAQSAASPVNASPGRHRIVVQAPGYNPSVLDVEVSAGGVRDVAIQLGPAGSGGPVAPDDQPTTQRSNVPAFVLLGVTGVGLVLGGVFGGMALSAKKSFNDHPKGNTSDADKAELDAKIADACFGVAIATGVTGLVLVLTNLPRRNTGDAPALTRRAFVTPYAGPTGGGVVGGLSF